MFDVSLCKGVAYHNVCVCCRCKLESAEHSKTVLLMEAEHAKLQKTNQLSEQLSS